MSDKKRQTSPHKTPSCSVTTLLLVLRLLVAILLAVSAVHLALGLGADALLGAKVAVETVAEPSLSSQNRFYGVAFALYAVVLYLFTTDPKRYSPVFKAALWVFFLAGCSRLVAWFQHGAPAPLVIALLASELLLPPLLLAWFARVRSGA